MKLITFTDEDAGQLLDDLELTNLRVKDELERVDKFTVTEVHRFFHHRVTRWLQNQGASPKRS